MTYSKNTFTKKKILCLANHILGGKTFSQNVHEYLSSQDVAHFDYYAIDGSDFDETLIPFYLQISDSLKSAYIARKKFKDLEINLDDYDAIIFLSYHLAIPYLGIMKKKPSLICLDSTPRLAHSSNIKFKLSLKKLVNYFASHILDFFVYRKLFKRTKLFACRTNTVQESLTRNYKISSSKMITTYSPLATASKRTRPVSVSNCHFLFIGEDFERKGGDFVIKMFLKHFQDIARLTIVSSNVPEQFCDASSKIQILKNLDKKEITALMYSADLFLFPSWKDEMGLVLCEAMTCGLPIIARQSSSQHELVITGKNGVLMAHQSTIDDWTKEISTLLTNQNKLTEYSQNSEQIARDLLSADKFHDKMEYLVTNLIE